MWEWVKAHKWLALGIGGATILAIWYYEHRSSSSSTPSTSTTPTVPPVPSLPAVPGGTGTLPPSTGTLPPVLVPTPVTTPPPSATQVPVTATAATVSGLPNAAVQGAVGNTATLTNIAYQAKGIEGQGYSAPSPTTGANLGPGSGNAAANAAGTAAVKAAVQKALQAQVSKPSTSSLAAAGWRGSPVAAATQARSSSVRPVTHVTASTPTSTGTASVVSASSGATYLSQVHAYSPPVTTPVYTPPVYTPPAPVYTPPTPNVSPVPSYSATPKSNKQANQWAAAGWRG